MALDQTCLFAIFTIDGILIGIVFDIFRILRKVLKTKDIITYIEDICFWIISGIIVLYTMCKFSNGELRFYMLLGIGIGITMYILTFSKYFIKITVKVINILTIPFKIIYKMTRKIIIKPIKIICINIRKNIIAFLRKIRGFFVKKEKYYNI